MAEKRTGWPRLRTALAGLAIPAEGTRGSALLLTALAAVFFAQSYSSSLVKSPSWDEPFHVAEGLAYVDTGRIYRDSDHTPLIRELSGLFLRAAGVRWPSTPEANTLINDPSIGHIPAMWMQYRIGSSLIRDNGPDRVMYWSRLPLILLGTGFVFLVYATGRFTLGHRAGLGAAFLYAFDPNIIAQSYLVTPDSGLAFFIMLFVFALWSYALHPGPKRMVFCGLALGAALGSKYPALTLVPVSLVLLVAAAIRPVEAQTAPRPAGARSDPGTRARLIRYGLAWLGMCGVAALLLEYIYLLPKNPFQYLNGMHLIAGTEGALYYLAGKLAGRFYSYYLAAILLKEPVATLIAIAAGLAFWLRSQPEHRLAGVFLLAPASVIFLSYTFASRDLGIRYMIPVLPFLFVFGGAGLSALLGSVEWKKRGFGLLLCAWLVASAAGIYPDHLSYFNESACLFSQPSKIGWDGGSRCGGAWLDESNVDWGQGLKQLRTWLDQNAPGRTVRLAYFGGFPPQYYNINATLVNEDELLRGTTPGLYAVSAHLVASLALRDNRPDGQWMQRRKPLAIVGHAYYIYEIP